MDKINHIRQLFYEQGLDIPAIIAETGHDRKTIVKYLDMTDFNLPEPEPSDPEAICPKLDRFKPIIDSWLLDDQKAPHKQRHTLSESIKDSKKKLKALTALIVLWPSMLPSKRNRCTLINKKDSSHSSISQEKPKLISGLLFSMRTACGVKANTLYYHFHTVMQVFLSSCTVKMPSVSWKA